MVRDTPILCLYMPTVVFFVDPLQKRPITLGHSCATLSCIIYSIVNTGDAASFSEDSVFPKVSYPYSG